MSKRRSNGKSTILVILAAFFLANLSAGGTVLWLIPGVERIEAVAWLVVLVGVGLILRAKRKLQAVLQLAAGNWILIVFTLFGGLSITWSATPELSLARWFVFIITILVAAFVGFSCDTKRLATYLGIVLALIVLISSLVVLLVPQIGVMNYHSIQGAWKGMYWHKNHMGLVAGFAAVVLLCNAIMAIRSRSKTLWLWAALYVLTLLFISQTDSAAAYMSVLALHVFIAGLLLHLKLKRRMQAYHYGILGALVLVALVAVASNLVTVFGLFNRNTTLTGRVPMWLQLFAVYLRQHPWGGFGFNAFWHIASHRTTMQHLAGYPDPIVIADNGFIDILMNTGILGLGLFLVFFLGLFWRTAKHAWDADAPVGLFPLIVMAYLLLANLTWSLLFENESFFMLVMLALMFSLSAHARARGGESNVLPRSI